MKTKKLKPVIVTCIDLMSFPRDIWKIKDLNPAEIDIIGFLWHKDKKKIILKRMLGHPEDEPFVIPMGCVKHITYLKEK